VGGDFNLIRKTSEYNKEAVLNKWSNLFNVTIEFWGMKEVGLVEGILACYSPFCMQHF
jgi:hypothetical protein